MSADVVALLGTLTAYQDPAVVVAACRTGLLDALGEAPAGAAALAERAGLAVGPVVAALAVLARLGLAEQQRTGYLRTPLTARLCDGGDLRAVVLKEGLFARVWTELDATLRTGRPVLAPWRDRLVDDPETARGFLEALVVLARETGPDLTTLVELGHGRTVLDVGGGLGSYAVPLSRAGAAVTLVELAPVAQWARQALADAEVRVVAADALAEPACGVAPQSVDTVLLAHVLHDLDDADAATILARVREALRPGGAVVVVEIPGDATGAGPLFDLMMQVETPGRARSGTALHTLLAEAGMVGLRDAAYPGPVLVTVGQRP